ncbi:hypothetical protein [Arthrobacter roseus]|uniref:hypothetical protein n=1 Tax=Arthrobacter roseus TaxID=136274 RepID=UPI0019657576|nr:hypothetical protein [Arthrobacter roseus]MBM7849549.1 hypothetical protein [Arthrobacter roseus]
MSRASEVTRLTAPSALFGRLVIYRAGAESTVDYRAPVEGTDGSPEAASPRPYAGWGPDLDVPL